MPRQQDRDRDTDGRAEDVDQRKDDGRCPCGPLNELSVPWCGVLQRLWTHVYTMLQA